MALTDFLARRDVFVLPGTAVAMPGDFRVSLTATDADDRACLARLRRHRASGPDDRTQER